MAIDLYRMEQPIQILLGYRVLDPCCCDRNAAARADELVIEAVEVDLLLRLGTGGQIGADPPHPRQ
jgi:hypothetical protein